MPPDDTTTVAPPEAPPAAPPVETPTPDPAPATDTPPAKADNSPFSKVDARARTVTKPAAAPDPKATPKPGDKPAADPNKVVAEAPRQLREKLQSASRERDEAMKAKTALEAKIADYEKRGLDTTALNQKLESREKEFSALQKELATIRYEKSEEFKKQYEAPFSQAASYAKEVVEQLFVTEGENERPATWGDFAAIYNLPHGKAAMAAKAMFGDSATTVMQYFAQLKQLDHTRQQALVDYEANADKRMTEERAKQVQQMEKVNSAWKSANDDIVAAHPDWFGERPEDEEGNAIWKESLDLVDRAYMGRDKLTDEERIVLDAHIRQRAAAFPRAIREIELLKAELETYKERLGEKTASTPGKTKKAGDSAKPPEKSMREEMAEAFT